jgi:hypothetical protein
MLATLANPTLTSLVLQNCSINDSALGSAAAALARLHSLRSLQFEQSGTMMHLAAQVTGLTSLEVDRGTSSLDAQLMLLASHNTQLQKLGMKGLLTGAESDAETLATGHLQHLLISCPGLTELVLNSRIVDQDGLDALLAHGTSITHLTLSYSSLTASRAHVPCSWRRVRLNEPSMQQLAYLPLRSVQELALGFSWATPHGLCSCLQLSFLTPAHTFQLTCMVSQAATNLATCPACTRYPSSVVGLGLVSTPFYQTPQQFVQLFEAHAPLSAMQLERLSIDSKALELGSPEVEALAHSLGDSIKALDLWCCTLVSSFWRPLAQHFPTCST